MFILDSHLQCSITNSNYKKNMDISLCARLFFLLRKKQSGRKRVIVNGTHLLYYLRMRIIFSFITLFFVAS